MRADLGDLDGQFVPILTTSFFFLAIEAFNLHLAAINFAF